MPAYKVVGGYRDIETMTKILNENNIDCFALCRAFIYESDLINRWQSRDLEPAKCISCTGYLKSNSTCVFKKKATNV
ncbi:hypothetical protein [Clostridium sp. DL-VIII]|uniref:hypothetical protein n=1 Tax=Clostridium sp. DL-VIII TaxID=641107 RepID=UPI000553DA3E|nr:hypothetical protein [Clostridium sp. DL-VIII]